MNARIEVFKQKAKRLKKGLARLLSQDIRYSHALELVAIQEGLANWDTLSGIETRNGCHFAITGIDASPGRKILSLHFNTPKGDNRQQLSVQEVRRFIARMDVDHVDVSGQVNSEFQVMLDSLKESGVGLRYH